MRRRPTRCSSVLVIDNTPMINREHFELELLAPTEQSTVDAERHTAQSDDGRSTADDILRGLVWQKV